MLKKILTVQNNQQQMFLKSTKITNKSIFNFFIPKPNCQFNFYLRINLKTKYNVKFHIFIWQSPTYPHEPSIASYLKSFFFQSFNPQHKPSITPPQWAFPVVWTILYIMIGISLWLYLKATEFQYTHALLFFAIQLVLNLLWTPLFFCCRAIKLALVDIFLLLIFIVLTIVFFHQRSPLAAYLLIPYLVWVCIATYLNLYIVRNNPDPTGK